MQINVVKENVGFSFQLRLDALDRKAIDSTFVQVEGTLEKGLRLIKSEDAGYKIAQGSEKSWFVKLPQSFGTKLPTHCTQAMDVRYSTDLTDNSFLLDKFIWSTASRREPRLRNANGAEPKKNKATAQAEGVEALGHLISDINRLARNLKAKLWVTQEGVLKARVEVTSTFIMGE